MGKGPSLGGSRRSGMRERAYGLRKRYPVGRQGGESRPGREEYSGRGSVSSLREGRENERR